MGGRWRWRLRRYRSQPAALAIWAVGLVVVAGAIDHGITTGRLNWTVLILFAMAVPAIILHEVSHGVVAYWCGDDTAKRAGRISLNPARHVDRIGTLILPGLLILLRGPFIGWAKPVPVTLNRLRRPRNQALLVGFAGPLTNGLLAVAAGVGVHFIAAGNPGLGASIYDSILWLTVISAQWGSALYWIGLVLGLFGIANVMIGILNLVPIAPLDGAALLERFIPISALPTYYRVRTGFIVFLLLLLWLDRGALGWLYSHLVMLWANPSLPHYESVVLLRGALPT
jgi:Zn-dependent protease